MFCPPAHPPNFQTHTQFYALHLDNRAGDCAKRAATFMAYLSDVAAGGDTHFPRSPGLTLERALQSAAPGWRHEPAAVAAPGWRHEPAAVAAPPRAALQGRSGEGRGRLEGLRVQPEEGRAVLFW
jgi:hypothetical protein